MWAISPKWTNKISEKGRGLDHVTLIKFGTPSNMQRCKWTISVKLTNENPEKWRAIGHVTPIKWDTFKHISKISKGIET